MKVILYTSFPCTIVSGNESEELDINEHLILENELNPILVTPKNKEQSPFTVELDNESSFYRVIKKEDKILIFLIDGILVENKSCHNFSYNGIKSSIEIGSKSILFSNEKDKKLVHITAQGNEIKVGSFFLIDYVFISKPEFDILIAYNPQKNTIKTFTADKINIEKDGFSLTKKTFNYESVEIEYFVDKEGLKIKNKTFKMTPTTQSPTELIVYKFMSAIKCEDWDGGISFLDKSLARKLDAASLKQFMGEISYFYMLDFGSCFAISNGKNKIFEFVLSENKITDINDN